MCRSWGRSRCCRRVAFLLFPPRLSGFRVAIAVGSRFKQKMCAIVLAQLTLGFTMQERVVRPYLRNLVDKVRSPFRLVRS